MDTRRLRSERKSLTHPTTTPHTHRLLGVTREASFEEVQDARNYLYEVSVCVCEGEREG